MGIENRIENVDKNALAIELLRKNAGKIIPTFNRETATAYYEVTGTNLSKVLFALANDGVVMKDFIRYTPKKGTPSEDGKTITMYVDGLQVIRKVGKDGKVAEAIFYLKDLDENGKPKYIPEWVQRRAEKETKVSVLIDEIRQFTEGLVDKLETAPEPIPELEDMPL
jgi:glucose-6-phosphate isomerase